MSVIESESRIVFNWEPAKETRLGRALVVRYGVGCATDNAPPGRWIRKLRMSAEHLSTWAVGLDLHQTDEKGGPKMRIEMSQRFS